MRANSVLSGIKLNGNDAPSTFAARAELAAREYLKALPQDSPIMTKEEFLQQVNLPSHQLYALCGDKKLSERAFERAWTDAPEPWRKAGRRPRYRG
jgi:hypothetical protein